MIRRILSRLLTRPRLSVPLPQLSKQDQARVAALLQSDGWTVVERFQDAVASNLEWQLLTTRDDHRYWQGQVAGLATFVNLAEWIVSQDLDEKEPQKTAEDLFFDKMSKYYG